MLISSIILQDHGLAASRGSGESSSSILHHRHANCNFAVIDYFWDRLLGTYRGVEATRQTAPGASLATKEIGAGVCGDEGGAPLDPSASDLRLQGVPLGDALPGATRTRARRAQALRTAMRLSRACRSPLRLMPRFRKMYKGQAKPIQLSRSPAGETISRTSYKPAFI